MALPFATLPSGIVGGGPAASVITANTRVKTQMGYVGLVTDVPQFTGPAVNGTWQTSNARTKVMGTLTISQATGIAVVAAPPPPTVPMTVASGDARAKGS